jgi:hypothetical protein
MKEEKAQRREKRNGNDLFLRGRAHGPLPLPRGDVSFNPPFPASHVSSSDLDDNQRLMYMYNGGTSGLSFLKVSSTVWLRLETWLLDLRLSSAVRVLDHLDIDPAVCETLHSSKQTYNKGNTSIQFPHILLN